MSSENSVWDILYEDLGAKGYNSMTDISIAKEFFPQIGSRIEISLGYALDELSDLLASIGSATRTSAERWLHV